MSESSERQPRVIAAIDVGSTRWLKLQTLKYLDRKGEERAWDVAVRTTTKDPEAIDAVSILAILSNGNTKEVVLVKQFRPPMRAMSIECPAGLIDVGETPEQAALRELFEETGLKGNVMESFDSVCSLTPGLSSEKIKLVQVHVDMTLPENQYPKQHLDEGEDIEVFRIPLGELRERLDRMHSQGCSIFAPLYYFAIAHELSAKQFHRKGHHMETPKHDAQSSWRNSPLALLAVAIPTTAALTLILTNLVRSS